MLTDLAKLLCESRPIHAGLVGSSPCVACESNARALAGKVLVIDALTDKQITTLLPTSGEGLYRIRTEQEVTLAYTAGFRAALRRLGRDDG